MSKRITIRFVGSDKDGGDVRLSDFIDQLDAFKDALRETERILSGEDRQWVYYKIVRLSHNSPAEMTLEAVAPRNAPVAASVLTAKFVSGLRQIRTRKKPPVNADLSSLESYRKLALPLQKHLQRVEVSAERGKVIPIDGVFTEKIDQIIGPDTVASGSIAGRLESVNLHNRLIFDIYPAVGPKRVRCTFQPELKDKVKRALDGYCTVTGKLRYKQWDQYPYRIDAHDIDPHEEDNKLPSLHDLRGLAPNSTEGMSAEEFVRSIRHGNW